MQLYTNEFTAELKAEIDRSPFSAEELAAMPEDARAIIAEQEAFHRISRVRAGALTPALSHRERVQTLKTATHVAVLHLPCRPGKA